MEKFDENMVITAAELQQKLLILLCEEIVKEFKAGKKEKEHD